MLVNFKEWMLKWLAIMAVHDSRSLIPNSFLDAWLWLDVEFRLVLHFYLMTLVVDRHFSLSDWELQLQLIEVFGKDCANNNGWYTNHWGLLFRYLYSPLCVWACEGGCVFGRNGLLWNAFLLQVWLMIISIYFLSFITISVSPM